jgi:hypothetical protein
MTQETYICSEIDNLIDDLLVNNTGNVISGGIFSGLGATGPAIPTVTITTSSNTNPYYNNWSNITFNGGFANTNSNSNLQVKGDAEFEGDVKIKGVSLSERFDKIEERLAILRPNEKLEGKWEELKALGDRYRELEKEILEKEKVWELLKR